MNNDGKNLILVVLLSFLFVFGWSYFNYTRQKQETTSSNNVLINSVNQEKKSNVKVFDSLNEEKEIKTSTNVFDIIWSNRGGVAKSIILKDEKNSEKNVELILSKDSSTAFNLKFGNYKDKNIENLFNYKVSEIKNGVEIEFWTDFLDNNNNKFKLTKNYKILNDDFLIELKVKIASYDNVIPNISENLAYTLATVPQIGPDFEKLDKGKGSYNFRNFLIFDGKKKKEFHKQETLGITKRVDWTAIINRYFTFIEIHQKDDINRIVLDKNGSSDFIKNEIFIERKNLNKLSSDGDCYKFYVGPRTKKYLSKYSQKDKNNFEYSNLNLENASSSGSGPIQFLIRGIMNFLHYTVHIKNWGVVIIVLTIIIKIILIPFTIASSKQTTNMQKLQPKMKEIQDKYRDNPQKMNMEMAKFYKQYNVNPAKGCLPVILQMFILIPLFNVLRTDYALRGEKFFGWITDLSLPDTVFTFSSEIPFIGSMFQNSIRVLPLLFVLTQILSTKIMQSPDQAGNKQMKIMMYALPLIFFFTLYNMPSGLFVYWIIMNILSTIQQLIFNKVLKSKATLETVPSNVNNKIVNNNKKNKIK